MSTLSAQRVGGAPPTAPIANLAVLGFSGDAGLDTFNMTTDPGRKPTWTSTVAPWRKEGRRRRLRDPDRQAKGKNQKSGTGAGLVRCDQCKPGSTPFFNYTSTETIHVIKP